MMFLNFWISMLAWFGMPLTEVSDDSGMHGKIYDAETKITTFAKISYKQLPEEELVGFYEYSRFKDEYIMPVNKVGKYLIKVSSPGYETLYDTVEIASANLNKDYYLKPIGAGRVLYLNDLVFERQKFNILHTSYDELNKVVMMMKNHPHMVIQLEGHTDYGGDELHNTELAKSRIEAVQRYLVKNGVKESHIKTKSYGGEKPIVIDPDPNKRARNRRVDIVIVKN